MFRSCDNKGFQIQFNNGYLISCQFGSFNYCSRRDVCDLFQEKKMDTVDSDDCELAIIDMNRERGGSFDVSHFVTGKIIEDIGLDLSHDDMVACYVSADDVAKIIAYVSKLEATK